MNISEFEQLLREQDPPQPFQADESGWLKLDEALRPKKRRGVIIPFSPKALLGVAASVLLLIGMGTYWFQNLPVSEPNVAASKNTTPGEASAIPKAADTSVNGNNPAGFAAGRSPNATVVSKGIAPLTNKEKTQNAGSNSTSADSLMTAGKQKNQQPAIQDRTPDIPKKNETQIVLHEETDPLPDDFADAARRLRISVTALYGVSEISKGQYRVSVDAQRKLGDRAFAKVQVVASAARINSTTPYQFQSISLNPSGAVPTSSTQQADANYLGNVFAVGVAPSFGYYLTKKIAVSGGPDLQKTLSDNVALDNKDAFRNQVTNQTLIDEQQKIAGLDLGVHSAIRMDITQRLGLNLSYRYGLTDYLKKKDGAVRNSFMSVGLSYQFK